MCYELSSLSQLTGRLILVQLYLHLLHLSTQSFAPGPDCNPAPAVRPDLLDHRRQDTFDSQRHLHLQYIASNLVQNPSNVTHCSSQSQFRPVRYSSQHCPIHSLFSKHSIAMFNHQRTVCVIKQSVPTLWPPASIPLPSSVINAPSVPTIGQAIFLPHQTLVSTPRHAKPPRKPCLPKSNVPFLVTMDVSST